MSRQDKILQLLIAEFHADGYECFEFKGRHFARIELEGEAVGVTDVDLTRLAGNIDTRLERAAA